MATTTTKTFDAVEMSRRLRAETSRKLAGLTRGQRFALLNARLLRDPRAEVTPTIGPQEPPTK